MSEPSITVIHHFAQPEGPGAHDAISAAGAPQAEDLLDVLIQRYLETAEITYDAAKELATWYTENLIAAESEE